MANDGRKPALKIAGVGVDDLPCDVHDALKDVVALGHADDFEGLAALRDLGRRCRAPFACELRTVEPPPRGRRARFPPPDDDDRGDEFRV